MLLEPKELDLFFRLHRALMFFVNQRLAVIPDKVTTPGEFAELPAEVRVKVRDALKARVELIESFVAENPARLTDDELGMLRSWRHLVPGKFYVFRELKKYTIFLTTTSPAIAYGVVALSQPFEDLIGPYLPVLAETVLLPFKDKIVYDGLMSTYNVTFGGGIRRSLNESFKEAKASRGIVTSLSLSDTPFPPKATKTKPAPKPASREQNEETVGVIIDLIDEFCDNQLNKEYAALCRKMAEKLARKRPSPLLHGNPSAWASGIVRTVGWVNFLHDKSQTPYMRLGDIDAAFGIGESTGAAKATAIRKMLRIHQLDPAWSLPSRLDDNPLVWILNVNGLMMDIRQCPREAQEIAFEKGLIPYIPAEGQ
jgi:hypothetical protein